MRVEAVRQALFTAADKNADGGSSEKLGNGILQAAAALAVNPPLAAALHKTAPDRAVFPLLRVLTGLGAAASPAVNAMLELEATQLAHRWSEHRAAEPDRAGGDGSGSAGRRRSRRSGASFPGGSPRASGCICRVEGSRRRGAEHVRAPDEAPAASPCRPAEQGDDCEGAAPCGAEPAPVRTRAPSVPHAARLRHRPEPHHCAGNRVDQRGHVQGAVGGARQRADRRVPRGDRHRPGQRLFLRAGRSRSCECARAERAGAERRDTAVSPADGLRGGQPDDPQLRARARPP